jgi:iron complex outermembrane receptor protein
VVHTRDPNLTKFEGLASGEFATANLRNITAAVNLPFIDDKLGLRVSGNRYEQDGYDAPRGGRRTSWDGRVKLLFKPTDNLSILVGGAMNNSEFFTGEYNLVVKYPPGVNPKTAAPIRGVDTKNRQFWTNINWDMDSIGVEYIGSYRTYTAEGGVYLTTLGQDVSTPYDRFYTNEVRVHSQNNSTLQWQAGVVHYANGLRDHNKIYTRHRRAVNETFTDKKRPLWALSVKPPITLPTSCASPAVCAMTIPRFATARSSLQRRRLLR